ncbi:purine permease 3 isoform X2 [Canna indica]|uniref:Purine permease 3 isoform X2 n=1 Tax=Canna indica TaxID=4628 RepID=A0AAQ3Q1Y7_9LILI|nr:purine permease 3 isoform X2 [Canna indica]
MLIRCYPLHRLRQGCVTFPYDTGKPLLLLHLHQYFHSGDKRQWLSAWLETGGWPALILPLIISFLYRRCRSLDSPARLFFLTPWLFLACTILGLLIGLNDFLYAYKLAFLPVSTSALLISTQLAFTALFAFLVVRQKFTPYSLNACGAADGGHNDAGAPCEFGPIEERDEEQLL